MSKSNYSSRVRDLHASNPSRSYRPSSPHSSSRSRRPSSRSERSTSRVDKPQRLHLHDSIHSLDSSLLSSLSV